jgi:N-methylhydantoinase A
MGDVPLATQQQVDGLPLRLRMLAIETIGAGGGSLARLDAGGVLRVGPQSAGASPGPIAYGRGGTHITVTDANVLLGRLHPQHFLGGQVTLDEAAVKNALRDLGKQLGRGAVGAAEGILKVANAEIERALRRVSIERGHDPRRFTLVAFGGAGPLHACEVADNLGMTQVLIPPHPGVLCALGLLLADVRVDHALPILAPATIATISQMRVWHTKLLSQARAELRADGVAENAITFEASADMRYVGQAYELSIPFEGDIVAAFHRQHERDYGYNLPDRTVEITTLRLRGIGTSEGITFQPQPTTPYKAQPQDHDPIARYDRATLRHGATLHGEAIITQLDATTYIPQGWSANVDGWGNIVIRR